MGRPMTVRPEKTSIQNVDDQTRRCFENLNGIRVAPIKPDDKLRAGFEGAAADHLGNQAAGAFYGTDVRVFHIELEGISSAVDADVERGGTLVGNWVSGALLGGGIGVIDEPARRTIPDKLEDYAVKALVPAHADIGYYQLRGAGGRRVFISMLASPSGVRPAGAAGEGAAGVTVAVEVEAPERVALRVFVGASASPSGEEDGAHP